MFPPETCGHKISVSSEFSETCIVALLGSSTCEASINLEHGLLAELQDSMLGVKVACRVSLSLSSKLGKQGSGQCSSLLQ